MVLASACGRLAFDDVPPPADACDEQVWFADVDGDGHGDPAASLTACTQPPSSSVKADDCDDGERHRYPGAPEVCDGFDNDCNASSLEVCAAQCVPARRPAPDDEHSYLLCGTSHTWLQAQSDCDNELFTLVTIDDAAENSWLLSAMIATHGNVDIFIGGTDQATEQTWKWPDGTLFWQGDGGGGPVGGAYTNWNTFEPNNGGAGGPEHCLLVLAAGVWNDADCITTTRPFACERN